MGLLLEASNFKVPHCQECFSIPIDATALTWYAMYRVALYYI